MIRRRDILGGLMALAPATVLAQSLSADNGVAAKVNGEPISTYDLVQRMRLLVLLSGLKPDEATVAWLQPYALNGLINDRLKGQEFERFRPLSELDGDIDEQIKAMSGGDPARMLAALDQGGVAADSLRALLRGQIAWANLVRGRMGGRVQVSPALAEQEAERLSAPDSAKVRLTGLFVADVSAGNRATALAAAAQLAAQARSGGDLLALAGTFSDPSPYAAGAAGRWMPIENLDTEVATRLDGAAAGAVSDPVEIREGVLLLTVLERYQPGGAAAPPVIGAETAGEDLASDRFTSLAGRYLRDLRASAEISA